VYFVSLEKLWRKNHGQGPGRRKVKGAVKEAVDKAIGDTKLESEGKADKVEGKIQNAAGGIKDSVREIIKK